jgi:hypothetical protein
MVDAETRREIGGPETKVESAAPAAGSGIRRPPAGADAAPGAGSGIRRPPVSGVDAAPAVKVAAPAVTAAGKAPPFILPGEHFAAAALFLVLGAAGLVVVTPALTDGFYPTMRVVATAHLFTLGWVTTSIMGALYQFLPVALGEPIRSVRVAHATFALYVPGLAAFVTGLASGRSGIMLVGAALLGAGVLLFVANLAATLRRSRTRDLTWWALAAASLYLVVTLILGLALTGNLRWAFLGGGRFAAVGVHLHVAIAGWVLLVMVGVAHRLLPMFLLSHGAGDALAKAAVGLLSAGAGMLAFLHHAPPLVSRWIPALLIAAGVICFLAQARRFYRHRHRPALDPGMRLAAAGLGLLGVGLVMAAPVLLGIATPRLSTAYVTALLLGISLFVAAFYYKIVPFLVWFHRFGPLAGKRSVPKVSELYSARAALLAALLLATGAFALVSGVALGSALFARTAAVVFAAGVAIEAFQMVMLARTHPREVP